MEAELPWLVQHGDHLWLVVAALVASFASLTVLLLNRRSGRSRLDHLPPVTKLDNLGPGDEVALEGELVSDVDIRIEATAEATQLKPGDASLRLKIDEDEVSIAGSLTVRAGSFERFSRGRRVWASLSTGDRVIARGRTEAIAAGGAFRDSASALRLIAPVGGEIELWSTAPAPTPLPWLSAALVGLGCGAATVVTLFVVGIISGALVIAGMSGSRNTSVFMASLSAIKPGGDSYKALESAYEGMRGGPERTELLVQTNLLAGDCEHAVRVALWGGALDRALELTSRCDQSTSEHLADMHAWTRLLRGEVAEAAVIQSGAGRDASLVLRHLIVAQRWQRAYELMRSNDGLRRSKSCLFDLIRAKATGRARQGVNCEQERVRRLRVLRSDAKQQIQALAGPIVDFDWMKLVAPVSLAERDAIVDIALDPAEDREGPLSPTLAAFQSHVRGSDVPIEWLPASQTRQACRSGEVEDLGSTDGWFESGFGRACATGRLGKVARTIYPGGRAKLDALAIVAPLFSDDDGIELLKDEILVPGAPWSGDEVRVDAAFAVAIKLSWVYSYTGDSQRSELWSQRAAHLASALSATDVEAALQLTAEPMWQVEEWDASAAPTDSTNSK